MKSKWTKPTLVDSPKHEPEGGYTLVEFVITAVLIMTVAGIAIFQLNPTGQDQKATVGMDQVKSTLRQARETAVSQRRSIVVQFVNAAASTACLPGGGISNCIELYQMVVSGSPPTATQATNPFVTMPIQTGVQFGTVSGEVDTPDAFGFPGSGGIEFGGISGGPGSGMMFQSDGTFTDGSGNPINGSVFLVATGTANSARAVTVMGNTGRIRAFRANGAGWFQ